MRVQLGGAVALGVIVLGAVLARPNQSDEAASKAEVAAPAPDRVAPATERPTSSLRASSSARSERARVVEEPPLEALDESGLRAEIASLERELDESHAIDRLNADDVEPDERAALGRLLARITRAKQALVDRQLQALTDQVDAYARTHDARLARLRSGAQLEP